MAADIPPIPITKGSQTPGAPSSARAESELRQMLQDGGVSPSGIDSFMQKVNEPAAVLQSLKQTSPAERAAAFKEISGLPAEPVQPTYDRVEALQKLRAAVSAGQAKEQSALGSGLTTGFKLGGGLVGGIALGLGARSLLNATHVVPKGGVAAALLGVAAILGGVWGGEALGTTAAGAINASRFDDEHQEIRQRYGTALDQIDSNIAQLTQK